MFKKIVGLLCCIVICITLMAMSPVEIQKKTGQFNQAIAAHNWDYAEQLLRELEQRGQRALAIRLRTTLRDEQKAQANMQKEQEAAKRIEAERQQAAEAAKRQAAEFERRRAEADKANADRLQALAQEARKKEAQARIDAEKRAADEKRLKDLAAQAGSQANNALLQTIAERDQQLKTMTEQTNKIHAELAQLRAAQDAHNRLLQIAQQEAQAKNDQIAQANRLNQEMRRAAEDAHRKLQHLQDQITRQNIAAAGEAQQRIADLEKQLSDTQAALAKAQTARPLPQPPASALSSEAQKRITDLEKQLAQQDKTHQEALQRAVRDAEQFVHLIEKANTELEKTRLHSKEKDDAIKMLEQQRKELQTKLKEREDRVAQAAVDQEKLKAQIAKLGSREHREGIAAEISKKLADANEKVKGLEAAAERNAEFVQKTKKDLDNNLQAAKKRETALNDQIRIHEATGREQKAAIAQLTRELENSAVLKDAEIAKIKKENSNLEKQVHDLQEQVRRGANPEQLRREQEARNALIEANRKLAEELEGYQAAVENREGQLKAAEQVIQVLRDDVKKKEEMLKAKIKELEDALQDLRYEKKQEIDKWHTSNDKLIEANKRVGEHLAAAQDENDRLTEQWDEFRQKFNALKKQYKGDKAVEPVLKQLEEE